MNGWKITSYDIAVAAMRTSYLNSQTMTAKYTFQVLEYGSYAFIGIEVGAATLARWSFMKASEKLAYFGLVGEGLSAANGSVAVSSEGAAAYIIQHSRVLIPRMRAQSPTGKPVIRVDKNGNYIID